MKKKIVLAVIALAAVSFGWCATKRLFQDDEKKILETIELMRQAAEAKNTDAFMEHFSGDYSDNSGNSKLIVYGMVKNILGGLEKLNVTVKDVDVLVTGDTAYATVTVTADAVKRGKRIEPFGTEQNPERPRVTFRKSSMGNWKIVKVDDVRSNSF